MKERKKQTNKQIRKKGGGEKERRTVLFSVTF
jgi:hypothetical protein